MLTQHACMRARSVMAQCLRAGQDQEAGDALSCSLLLAGAFGTIILLVLEVICDGRLCHIAFPSQAMLSPSMNWAHAEAMVCWAPQIHGPALIARTGCAAALVEPAWEYLRIRALAAPAVLLTMAAQVPQCTGSP